MESISNRTVSSASAIAGEPPPAPSGAASASATAVLLPAPSMPLLGGDSASEIAAMVLEMGHDDRAAARASRDQQDALARSAESAELDAMKRRSDEAFAAGVIAGAATAASGAVTLAGIGVDGKAAAGIGGGAKLLEGGGKIAGAAAQKGADDASVEVTANEQLAGRFHRAADEQRDTMKAARDLGDQAIAFFKEYVAARGEAQKALLFRA